MPRKAIVTRTIKTTLVTALCLNLETEESYEQMFLLAGHFRNQAQLQRVLEKEYNSDKFKVVYVKSSEESKGLYAMDEQKFLVYGYPIPRRIPQND